MGGITKAVGGLFGSGDDEAKAARRAGDAQVAATNRAIDVQEESRDLAREDLAPFKEAGQRALPRIESLVSDPEAQKEFITNNPFFNALAERASSNITKATASGGKVGTGGTAEALQNSLLLTGVDLVNNRVNQEFNLANIGQSSAAGQANVALSTGANISELNTQQGNAQAASIIGEQNAQTNANSNLINTGLGIAGILRLG